MDLATADITFLPGVGERRAALLRKDLDIRTAEDLVRLYPYKYIDRTRFYRIREIESEDTFVQIRGQITRFERVGSGRTERLTAIFSDGEDTIQLVWFKGAIPFVLRQYKTGVPYVLFGRPSLFQHEYNFAHPELEPAATFDRQNHLGLEPYYNTSERMKDSALNSRAMRKIQASLANWVRAGVPETLPSWILQRYHLMTLTEALLNIHFPANQEVLKRAQERLKFEELFYIELQILRLSPNRNQKILGYPMPLVGHYFNTFYRDCLPFELTGAQKRVVREVFENMKSGHQMNRLIQGDVGSGKTLVALLCCLLAIDNGYQACLMAPTEILATQHLETLLEFTAPLGLNIALLKGSTPKRERDRIHAALMDGSLQLLIGTHALLEDTVQWRNLGLAVIDEQHRFGVKQRARLWAKNHRPPHILVMTATPIPRTLAMTVYGDLAVSQIDEMPPGRKPVQTFHRYLAQQQAVDAFLLQQINEGRQVYIVYPLIEENQKLDLQALEQGYEYYQLHFPACNVVMVHGRMKPAEKEAQMQLFVSGQSRILVATTVIEVGVNVPNASVMVIQNAERFGLSQLHQLRGRVGRGADQSYCILLTNVKLGKDTRQRMNIMCRTNDGFEIAEADMQLRGPGDIEGTQQSGLPFALHLANLCTDGPLVTVAHQLAGEILDADPMLESPDNQLFVRQLQKLKAQQENWGVIS